MVGALASLLLAGCIEDPPGGDVRFSVAEARLEPGHCTWGERNGGYGPEWCHVVLVEAHNDDPDQDADVSSTAWEADGDDRATYGFPRVEGEGTLPAGGRATVELRFDSPEDVRLTTLHHIPVYTDRASAQIPDY